MNRVNLVAMFMQIGDIMCVCRIVVWVCYVNSLTGPNLCRCPDWYLEVIEHEEYFQTNVLDTNISCAHCMSNFLCAYFRISTGDGLWFCAVYQLDICNVDRIAIGGLACHLLA
jgi:hypothetical protein